MKDLLYINLLPVGDRFAIEAKVRKVAEALKCNPDHLMQVMKAETANTLNPAIQNKKFPFYRTFRGVKTFDGFATGLIQFTPDTARKLGTTVEQLAKMNFVQQMDYVYQYLRPYTGKLNTYFDVYLVIFFPVAAGYSSNDSYVFEAKNLSRASIARSNPAIDINKDGTITMAEFKQYLKNTVNQSLWGRVFDTVVSAAKGNAGTIATFFFWLGSQLLISAIGSL